MNIILQGTNFELSDWMRDLVDEKLHDCIRSLGDMNLEPVEIRIELELTTRRHPQEKGTEQLYRSEANVSVPGRLIRVEGTAPDLTQAVVQMKHKLTREIQRWRIRLIEEARKGGRMFKERVNVAEPSTEPD